MKHALQHQQSLDQLVRVFESIQLDQLDVLAQIYSEDVWFKDPFNEVSGIAAVTEIFRHMFTQVDAPRFVVTAQILQDDQAFLSWNFLFRMKRFSSAEQCIRGATHLRFNDRGQVTMHRDYWDAAEELYEKLPVLGALMRGLKKLSRA